MELVIFKMGGGEILLSFKEAQSFLAYEHWLFPFSRAGVSLAVNQYSSLRENNKTQAHLEGTFPFFGPGKSASNDKGCLSAKKIRKKQSFL